MGIESIVSLADELKYVDLSEDNPNLYNSYQVLNDVIISGHRDTQNDSYEQSKYYDKVLIMCEVVQEYCKQAGTGVSKKLYDIAGRIYDKIMQEQDWKLDLKADRRLKYCGEVVGEILGSVTEQCVSKGAGSLAALAMGSAVLSASCVILGPSAIVGIAAAPAAAYMSKTAGEETSKQAGRFVKENVSPQIKSVMTTLGENIGNCIDNLHEKFGMKAVNMGRKKVQSVIGKNTGNVIGGNDPSRVKG